MYLRHDLSGLIVNQCIQSGGKIRQKTATKDLQSHVSGAWYCQETGARTCSPDQMTQLLERKKQGN